ncbi:unnamed protein product [Oikopleura dioica]|uniref:Uncharacterized protein n=1 Tax=Oikopleura dioica TaxID=34765 RepID=E4Z3E9_OIKDI|nr:unnamed protein product [Oikopleura dioica]
MCGTLAGSVGCVHTGPIISKTLTFSSTSLTVRIFAVFKKLPRNLTISSKKIDYRKSRAWCTRTNKISKRPRPPQMWLENLNCTN